MSATGPLGRLLRVLALIWVGLVSPAALAFDLVITQFNDVPDPAVAGGTFRYELVIGNSDPLVASPPESELTVSLDANETVAGALPAGCAFEAAPVRQVRCALGSIAPDSQRSLGFDVRYTAPGSAQVAATARLTPTSGDDNTTNNEQTQNTTINQGADLRLTKAANPTSVPQGGRVTFLIDATNLGPNVASGGIRITDTLPGNVSFVSASGSGWSCSAVGQQVTCDRPADVPVNGAAPQLSIVAQLSAGIATGNITNSAAAAPLLASIGDGDPNNNVGTVTFQVVPGADLSIGKSVTPSPAISGQPVSFTLTPRNLGPSAATSVTVTDPLPPGFTGISASGTGWSCAVAGQVVTCTRANYAAAAANDITINATAPNVATLQTFNNVATIAAASLDPAAANNSATRAFNVQPNGADLRVAKTKSPNPVALDAPVTSVITVTNDGPLAVAAGDTITVTDDLPAGECYTGFSGAGWSCPAPPASAPASCGAQTITCTRSGPLARAASAPALTISTIARVAGLLSNTACVGLSGATLDAVPGNNCSTRAATSTTNRADLAVVKSADRATLAPTDGVLTYTLTVTNNGPDTATGVRLVDPVPMFTSSPLHGSTGVVATASNGAACTGTSTVTCTLGTLQAGDTVTVTVAVSRPMLDGTRTNTASVTSSDVGDPNLGNNQSSASVTVQPVADVEVTSKTIAPPSPRAGTNITYVVNFRNNGPSVAQAVSVTDDFTLPPGDPGFTFVSATCSKAGCTCSLAAGRLTCNAGNMASGETQSATLVIRPNFQPGPALRTYANTAAITTTTQDANAANNARDASVVVLPALLDLLVNKQEAPTTPDPFGFDPGPAANNFIDYDIRITNNGPSFAVGATLTDTMTTPAGRNLEFVGVVSGGTCNLACAGGGTSFTGTQAFACGPYDLAPAASCTARLRFRVINAPAVAGDTYSNLASVASNEVDAVPGNNSEGETTTVRVRADVQVVSKTAVPATVSLRQPFQFTILNRNNGPGDSTVTTVTDTLPAGLEFTGPAPVVTTTQGSCTLTAANAFRCDLGLLAAAGTATITLNVRALTPGALVNTARITTDQVDPVAGNNQNSGTVTVQKSSLAGNVFRDLDDDGVIDAGEAGIGAVTLTLTGTDAFGNPVSVTVSSAPDGSYLFDNLPPAGAGGYTITQSQPAGFFDGRETAGNAGGTVNNAAFGNGAATNQITGIALPANTAATGYLFGELPAARVAGAVYLDRNNDGNRDAGEPGLNGATAPTTITLTGTDYAGNPVSLTTTIDAAGNYAFNNVPPAGAGGYTVTQVNQPAGFLDALDQNGAGLANVIPGSAGRTAPETIPIPQAQVGPGANATERNFGEIAPATVIGSAFLDTNGDGVRQPGETVGIPGVPINLDVTGTNDLGLTVNCSLTTGSGGAFSFDLSNCPNLRPGSYTVTATAPPGLTSTTALTRNLTVTPDGGIIGPFDFGFTGTNGLAGSVYVDANNNGLRDAGEPGIPGVTVTLSGNAQAGVSVCTLIASCVVTTDANGNYSFVGLPASDGAGYTLTETQPAAFADGQDRAGTVNGVATGTAGNDVISGIVMPLNANGVAYNFGERGARLSGSVYIDANDNGVREAAEVPVASVQIVLSGTTVNGANVCTVVPSCTVTTDASGNYAFANLPAGTYTLTEAQPPGLGDGRETAGSSGGTVNNANFGAAQNQNQIANIPLAAGADSSGNLFGERTGAITGRVCRDLDNDGCEPGEPGIAGVTITLTGTDVDGNPVNITVVTDANGNYSIPNLRAADPAGYTLTQTNPAGFFDGRESSGLINGVACAACVTSDVGNTSRIAAIPFDPSLPHTNFDFAELAGASIAGAVYHDANGNGQREPAEAIAGVIITLSGQDDLGNPVSAVTVTTADGAYRFDSLRPGTYTVTETQPAGIDDGPEVVGTLGGNTAVNDSISGIVLPPGTAATGYDFREVAASLAGVVYQDVNLNGVRDGGEPGIPGVSVNLSGDATRTAVTDAQGNFLFAGLVAGSYTLTEIQPANFADGADRAGTAGGTLGQNAQGNDTVSGIALAIGQQATGYEFGERLSQPGTISGRVWMDSNHDRADNDGPGSGRANWLVELLRPGSETPVATVRSNETGDYSFTNVAPDTGYRIRFRHPENNFVWGLPFPTDPAATADGARVENGEITNLTLRSGANVVRQDLPLDPNGVVYNSVTRAPVSGATVELLGPPGFNPAIHLIGGAANLSQLTGSDGFYQYILLPGAPTGTYQLRVTAPTGFAPAPSTTIAPCVATLVVGPVPAPAVVQNVDAAPPPLAAPQRDPAACPADSSGLAAGAGSTQYYLAFSFLAGAANLVNNHIPLDPLGGGQILVRKVTPLINVARGDLVPYTVTATNLLTNSTLANVTVRDLMPPGFKYRSGSATVNGVKLEPAVTGRELSWAGQNFSAGETKSFKLILLVGTGVGDGEYTNQAFAANGATGAAISNVATATVRIVPDPTFDCSDIIGKVFDDRNTNGYQDQGEPGIPNVRLATARGLLVTTDAQGRFHVPCAAVPNPDRGSNFVMKLDERTLPSGYRVTTENPRDVRVTRGKMTKLNFGATIHRVVRLEVSGEAFEGEGSGLRAQWQQKFDALPATLKDRPSVVRIAYRRGAEPVERVKARIEALREALRSRWAKQGCCYQLAIEDEIVEGGK